MPTQMRGTSAGDNIGRTDYNSGVAGYATTVGIDCGTVGGFNASAMTSRRNHDHEELGLLEGT